jgi:cytidine deaminase
LNLKEKLEMRNLEIEKKMYQIAKSLVEKRYPVGWGGAAVIRTDKDNYFSSVPIETANSSAILCIEVGAMCEAHKYKEKVTHCLCVVRDDEKAPYKVLSPCGICQERLRFWGEDVQVGVTTNNGEILFVELKELQPYHWTNAYNVEELERFVEEN